MLLGERIAYPQPFARTCCCQVGPAGTGGPPRPAGGGPPRPPPRPPNPVKPNSMITGTGPVALAGVVSVNWMSTVICGYEELSTCPTSFFVITGTSPFVSLLVSVTSHFTAGVCLGTLP